jgi:hypothetical protein
VGGTNYTHNKGEHPTCPKEHQTPHTEQHANNYYKATLHATGVAAQQQKQTTSSNGTETQTATQT